MCHKFYYQTYNNSISFACLFFYRMFWFSDWSWIRARTMKVLVWDFLWSLRFKGIFNNCFKLIILELSHIIILDITWHVVYVVEDKWKNRSPMGNSSLLWSPWWDYMEQMKQYIICKTKNKTLLFLKISVIRIPLEFLRIHNWINMRLAKAASVHKLHMWDEMANFASYDSM